MHRDVQDADTPHGSINKYREKRPLCQLKNGFNIRSAFAKATAGQVWDIPATFKGASLTHIGENVIGIMEIVQLVAVLDNNSHSFQQIRIVWFCFHLLSLLYGAVNFKCSD